MITIIIPVKKMSKKVKELKKSLLSEDVEIILEESPLGRGYPIISGVKKAKGDVVLILHVDTKLPKNWKKIIIEAMKNESVVGGGFTLGFDKDNLGLAFLVRLSKWYYLLTREIWGDRAVFVKTHIIKKYLNKLDVPIMEDIILSKNMRKYGKVVILKNSVTTSARKFDKRFVSQSLKVIKCRSMYALGFSLEKIYKTYYSTK